jgi:hypothetical protein
LTTSDFIEGNKKYNELEDLISYNSISKKTIKSEEFYLENPTVERN